MSFNFSYDFICSMQISTKYNLYFLLGLLFFLALLSLMILWWYACSQTADLPFEESVKFYLEYFPKAIRNPVLTTVLCLSLGIISISFLALSLRYAQSRVQKATSIIFLGFASLFSFWQLFSLM